MTVIRIVNMLRDVSQAFLSYSRTDASAAADIRNVISSEQRSVWVDVEGIRPAAEWKREIRSAIESSDAFVFLMSPQSIASSDCLDELTIAVSLGKRIVPVVIRSVDPSVVPPDLAHRQWIFMRAEDDRAKAVDRLTESLDQDLDWVGEHTRLGLRALEWQRSTNNPSYLLRGQELSGAELWLAQGAGRQPAATALHTEYIIAARRQQVRQQRRLIVVGSVVLIAVIALAAVAFTQRRQAVRQQQQTVKALSKTYVTEAKRLQTSNQTSDAVAYLARALELDPTDRHAATRLLAMLTYDISLRPPEMLRIGKAVEYVHYSTDDRVLFVLAGNAIKRLNAETLTPAAADIALPSSVQHAVFADDADRAAIIGQDGRTAIWDLAAGRSACAPDLGAGYPTTDNDALVSISPNGTAAAVYAAGTLHLIDVNTCSARKIGRYADQPLVVFAPRSTLLLVVNGIDLAVHTFDGRAAFKKTLFGNGFRPPVVGFAPDEEYVFAVSYNLGTQEAESFVQVYALPSGRTQLQQQLAVDSRSPFRGIESAVPTPDGFLALIADNGTVTKWDVHHARPVAAGDGMAFHLRGGESAEPWVRRTDVSADGRRVAVFDGSIAYLFDSNVIAVTHRIPYVGDGDAIDFSRDGRWLAIGGSEGDVVVWQLAGARAEPLELSVSGVDESGRLVEDMITKDADVQPIARPLAAVTRQTPSNIERPVDFDGDGNEVIVRNVATNAETMRIPLRGGCFDTYSNNSLEVGKGACTLHVAPDSRRLLRREGNRIEVFDLLSGRSLLTPLLHDAEVASAEFADDGQAIFSVAGQHLYVWDALSGKLRHRTNQEVAFSPLLSLFSQDGRLALAFDSDDEADNPRSGVLFDLERGAQAPVEIEAGRDTVIVPLPQVRAWLSWAIDDNRVFVRSLDNGRLLLPPLRHDAVVQRVAISGDAAYAAVATRGQIRVWDLASGDVIYGPVSPIDLDELAGLVIEDVRFSQSGHHVILDLVDDPRALAPVTTRLAVELVRPAGQAPRWLIDLAERLVGVHVTDGGVLEAVPDGLAGLVAVRDELRLSSAGFPESLWGRWLASPATKRTATPLSKTAPYGHPTTLEMWSAFKNPSAGQHPTPVALRPRITIESVWTSSPDDAFTGEKWSRCCGGVLHELLRIVAREWNVALDAEFGVDATLDVNVSADGTVTFDSDASDVEDSLRERLGSVRRLSGGGPTSREAIRVRMRLLSPR